MRIAPPVVLDTSQQETLKQWASSRSLPARQVETGQGCAAGGGWAERSGDRRRLADYEPKGRSIARAVLKLGIRLKNEFFDPHDVVQVKYEMLCRVSVENASVSAATEEYGVSKPLRPRPPKGPTLAHSGGSMSARSRVYQMGKRFSPHA